MVASITSVVLGTTLGPASDGIAETGLAFARVLGVPARLLHAAPTHCSAAERDERLRRLRAQARRVGLTVRPDGPLYEMRLEPAAEALLRESREPGVALVIGSRETAGWLGAALGSVARRVLSRASCPVLVARGPLRDLRVLDRAPGAAGWLGLWGRPALLRRVARAEGSVLVWSGDASAAAGLAAAFRGGP